MFYGISYDINYIVGDILDPLDMRWAWLNMAKRLNLYENMPIHPMLIIFP